VTPRILIVLAVLGAGCEQLKSPKRIHDLEGRVDELTTEVAALKGKPTTPKAAGHAGSGSAGEAPPAAAAAGSDSGSAAGHEARPAADAPAAHDGSGSAATVEPTAKDAGVPGDADQGARRHDPAMDHLLDVVAKNTAAPKHGEPAALHWGYDGKLGPAAWGTLDPAWGTCATGKAQSPIDIEPKAGTATPIVFHYKATAATIIDNGHTLQINLALGSSIEIEGVTYELVQFHFHTPSEHTIAGEHYPLELHLVHKDGAGKLAVIGVLYDVGAESKVLGGLWSAWPHKVGAEDKLKKPFDPSALLPETRTVFRYAGSLTTPPCTEGVVWNVMRRTLSDARPRLDAFGLHYKLNARDVQPRGERKIE
jgi:carbonic anhydrase